MTARGREWVEGKADPAFMSRVVYKSLGAKSRSVLIGPGEGLDNAVVSLPGGGRLVVTADPASFIPKLGPELSAWLSVHLVGSDYTSSGAEPEFALFSYDFPVSMTAPEREAYARGVGAACRELGVSIVGGHTGSYGTSGHIVGAGVMFGAAREGSYVAPSMAREGDAVLMTKEAGVEAAAYLAASFPEHVSRSLGAGVAGGAASGLRLCSTVSDARAAASVGLGGDGVTSMHDATEGGVIGGLREMAAASGHAFVVEKEGLEPNQATARVCSLFCLDPLTSPSEGALLLTCSVRRVAEVEGAIRKGGSEVRRIGTVQRGSGLWLREGGRARRARPVRNEYWKAYSEAERSGLR